MLILFLLILSASVGVYGYMRYAVNASLARAKTARGIVVAEQANKMREQSISDIYAATAGGRSSVRGFFLSDGDAVALIESLEKLGNISGAPVVLSNVNADDTSGLPAGSFATIHAHLEATGSWTAVMRTLELSETLPYTATLSGIRLDWSGNPTDKNTKATWKLSYDIAGSVIVQATTTPATNQKP